VPILPAHDPAFVAPAQAPGVMPGSVRGGLPPEPVAPVQPPIAGVIDPPRAPATPSWAAIEASEASESDLESSSPRPSSRASDAQARGKRHAPAGELNISQVWYDEGDELSGDDDAPSARAARARKLISPSVTDVSYYDERPRRRWVPIAVIGAFGLIGATLAFALTRGGSTSAPPPPPPREEPVAVAPADAAPSTILPAEPTPPPTPPADTSSSKTAAAPPRASEPRPTAPSRPPAATDASAGTRAPAVARRSPADTSYPVLGSEPTRRTPTLPTGTGVTAPTTTQTEPKQPSAPSLTDAPQDPYGADTTAPSDGVAAEKKAEFFANLGAQQLINGDTAGAAANFKKAIELDGKSVAAIMGMGEIALRQGLFGDAIAHLTKATKLAPKSAKAFTLLGEAYLNSGNNTQAAAQFKKALQLDPDNARARDGYNEASSRVPPPDDEAP
jgi:TolA-binding protein